MMIKIENVCVEHNKCNVLDNIDLKVEPGDFWLIFGPNGAGKTTLLKILSGLIPVFKGSLSIYERDHKEYSK
jgi:ABC-type Mn2+/Zn2+ transport system ATPase subunit